MLTLTTIYSLLNFKTWHIWEVSSLICPEFTLLYLFLLIPRMSWQYAILTFSDFNWQGWKKLFSPWLSVTLQTLFSFTGIDDSQHHPLWNSETFICIYTYEMLTSYFYCSACNFQVVTQRDLSSSGNNHSNAHWKKSNQKISNNSKESIYLWVCLWQNFRL